VQRADHADCGKTAIAIDSIIAQRDNWASGDPQKQVRCIYVAVGQKASTVSEVVETLRQNGALDYTVIVNASASDPTPFQYIAPYAGAALGAYWMHEGNHALVVYDDLSKQATAYRTLSPAWRPLVARHTRATSSPAPGCRRAAAVHELAAADRAVDHRDRATTSRVHPGQRDSITDGQITWSRPVLRRQPRDHRHVGLRVGEQVGARRSPAGCGSTSLSTAPSRPSRSSAPSSTRRRSSSSRAAPGSSRC
jgi:hypothetical protein